MITKLGHNKNLRLEDNKFEKRIINSIDLSKQFVMITVEQIFLETRYNL